MEKLFGIELRKFTKWPHFVESGQRRNLLTHSGGAVSEQYLLVCKKEGYPFSQEPKVGEILALGPKYFLNSTELLMIVGVMLGQTLWRKLFPEEMSLADTHLNDTIYECLLQEKWERAINLAEFSCSEILLRQAEELAARVRVVNFAIALKFSGRTEDATKLLAKWDWSASLREFRLADAVLNEQYSKAASIMLEIGKAGELIHDLSYHVWPLFREFRQTPQFFDAYEKIYGYSFVDQLQVNIDLSFARAESAVEKRKREITGSVVTPPLVTVSAKKAKRSGKARKVTSSQTLKRPVRRVATSKAKSRAK